MIVDSYPDKLLMIRNQQGFFNKIFYSCS